MGKYYKGIEKDAGCMEVARVGRIKEKRERQLLFLEQDPESWSLRVLF
ncbi:MAG: hypothetical protein ACM3XO_14345 [Bacteroidota bacterium]